VYPKVGTSGICTTIDAAGQFTVERLYASMTWFSLQGAFGNDSCKSRVTRGMSKSGTVLLEGGTRQNVAGNGCREYL
jgi:hypothetical protein